MGQGLARLARAELSIEGSNLDGFSQLVGDIYDCALTPERWPSVLRTCAAFVGAHSASLIGKGRVSSSGGMFYHDGALSPEFVASYFTEYSQLDPSTGAHLMASVEAQISTQDVVSFDEFHQTRFYLEWAAPQGLVDSIMVPLERSADWAAMLAILLTNESIALETCKARAALIVPHVRRAALIGKVLEQQSLETTTLKEAYDGLSAGMFLVDEDCRLVHANAAAKTLIARGDLMTVRHGRLYAKSGHAGAQLDMLFAASANGDTQIGTSGMNIALEDREGERYAAHVLPLTGGRRTGAHATAVAALFVHKATIDIAEPPEIIAKAYGLTLTELRVMMSIVHVGGVPETAEALGIAETTVKTHLTRVFGKTGLNRQADLVRLVAGFAGPLAH